MKLLKKAGALLLAVSLIPAFSVLAETSYTYTDNLNKYTEDKTMPFSGYGNATYASDVFVQNSGNYGFIDADGGADGTAALQMTQRTDGNNVNLKTRVLDLSAAEKPIVLFCYDINIMQNADNADKSITLGGDLYGGSPMFKLTTENGVWKFADAQGVEASYEYTPGRWYKVVLVTQGADTSAVIIDQTTGEVVISSEKTYNSNRTQFNAAYLQSYKPADGVTNTCVIMLDNVTLTMYDAANHAPEIVSATVEADDKNMPRNQELTFTFDQELSDNSTVTLAKKDGTPLTVTGVKTTKTLYNTLSVTYNGLLEKGTEYVLSFDGVTNGKLTCPDSEISFTTEDLHLWNDITVSSAAANKDNAALTDVTFTIGEKYGYPIFSGSVMAAVYQEGKMIEVDMQPLTDAKTGEVTVSFELGTVPADAKIGIILLDVENGPIPLAGGMLEN